MSGRHLSSSRAHVAARAAPEHRQLLSWHTEMGQTELQQQLSHCCMHTTTSGVKKIIKNWVFCADTCSLFPFCNPTAMGAGQQNCVHCPIPLGWKDQAANAAALGGIFTEGEAKFKGGAALPALSVLRQLSKEKSRLRKRSDLFDDFVISVLELRLFYVCFKITKSWNYVRG